MCTRVSLLSILIFVHKLEIVCFSKTYRNLETSSNNGNLEVPEQNFIREDNLFNSNYGTDYWSIMKSRYLLKLFSSFEIRFVEKCFKLACLYGFPSHTHNECENFLKNFRLNLDKIHEFSELVKSASDEFNAGSNSC